MLAQISQKEKNGFTNRPKDDILTLCEEKGFAIIIELVVIPNTGEWHLTTGPRWVLLFFYSWLVSF